MASGNHRTGSSARLQVGALLALCAGMVACASSQPVQAAKADFNGVWSVKLCDKQTRNCNAVASICISPRTATGSAETTSSPLQDYLGLMKVILEPCSAHSTEKARSF